MKEILNFTPHQVTIVSADGTVLKSIPSSGLVRLTAKTVDTGVQFEGCKITKTVYGEPVGLPEQVEGVFYIVSQLVKTALQSRTDLLVPAEIVRDSNGNILGCQSLGI